MNKLLLKNSKAVKNSNMVKTVHSITYYGAEMVKMEFLALLARMANMEKKEIWGMLDPQVHQGQAQEVLYTHAGDEPLALAHMEHNWCMQELLGGSHYTHTGGGVNYLRLPEDPQYADYHPGVQNHEYMELNMNYTMANH